MRQKVSNCFSHQTLVARMFRNEMYKSFKIIGFGAAVLCLALVSVIAIRDYQEYEYEEEERLRVWVFDRLNETSRFFFYDDEFNESFDYSQIYKSYGKRVVFYQKLNTSEFSRKFWFEDTEELEFADIEEVCQFLRDLGVPNVVIGFVEYVSYGTFEEAFIKVCGHPPGPDVQLGDRFGDTLYNHTGVFYDVWRHRTHHITVTKRYLPFRPPPYKQPKIWTLDAILFYGSDPPIFIAKFTRFRYDYRW